MLGRCIWSNRESAKLKEIVLEAPNRIGMKAAPRAFQVLPEYEEDLRLFIERLRRFGLLFGMLMTTLSVATVFLAVLRQFILLGLTIALMGVVVLLFPFATPRTVTALGFKKSIALARVAALGVIGLGIYFAVTLR